ncbi:MAG: hypothetical protein JXR22_12155 [Prolixibacteraceae bacterium]|nr:hypothetical protein [Prolixibacteraceae bacterium]
MKKIIVILLLILLLIVSALLATPFLFKEKISRVLLEKANNTVEATIAYRDFRLTLLRSFPDFTASFQGLSVLGKHAFEGDTLIYMDEFSLRIDLRSVIRKEDLLIKSVGVEDALFQFIIDEEGRANYDIEKMAGSTLPVQPEKVQTDESIPMKMILEAIELNNVAVVYHSIASDYLVSVQGINAAISGSLEGMNTLLDVVGNAQSLQIQYHGTDYLKDRSVAIATKMTANFDTWEFQFLEGDTRLNNLPLWIEGGFSMPGDSMFFDLNFNIPDMNMAQLIDLIPVEYQQQFDSIHASGDLQFNGIIKGLYYEDIFPKVDIRFDMLNGKISTPQLPHEVIIHELTASISMPEGSMDQLSVGIQNLDLQMAGHPFKLKASLSDLFGDPYMDINAKGSIDLETLAGIIPAGKVEMKGLLNADARVLGNYSALESNNFTAFVSSGRVDLSNFQFKNEQVPQGLTIQQASLILKNQDLQINHLNGNIGRSDFALEGEVKQLLTYLFANDVLKGNFSLQSKKIDANEFMPKTPATASEPVANSTAPVDSVEQKVMEFPQRMHLIFTAQIAELLYDQMNITGFKGSIVLKDQQLTLNGLTMNMLDGLLSLDGTVLADGRDHPDVSFRLNVQGFDLPTAYQHLSVVQKYLPIAAKSEGEFSTRLNVQSQLNSSLKMVLSALTANGQFSTNNVKLLDRKTFAGLSSVIQHEKLKNLVLDNFTTHFSIANGNLNIDPFQTKLADQTIKMGGTYNLGGTLNFRVDAQVEKAILAEDIQKMIAYIPGHQRVTMLDVGFDIRGNAKNPELKVDTDQIKKQVIDQVKNSSKEEIQDAAKKLIQDFFR